MRPFLVILVLALVLVDSTFAFRGTRCNHDRIVASLRRQSAASSVKVSVIASNATVTTYSASTEYSSIRIAAFFGDLDDSSRYCTKAGKTVPNYEGKMVKCTSKDVLTSEKKNTLKTTIVPGAIQLHAERLMVQSVGNTVLSKSTIDSNAYCSRYIIPSSHYTTGYDADFLLYVSAAPTSGDTIAWAVSCGSPLGYSSRPTAGVINVSPAYISSSTETLRTVTHEILHALGFSNMFFQIHYATGLRGKTKAPVLATANVVAQAQAFYGCAEQSFMELEDEGGAGTAGSHWKRRSAKDELMCGRMGVSRYSNLTIAAMEDLGFYKGVYSYGEYMAWGNGVGCTLTSSKCITNSVSNIPSMFCTRPDSTGSGYRCPSDRLSIGTCYITTSCSSVPSIYQYFTGNTLCGESDFWTDYCPYVEAYSNTGCMDGDTALMRGSYITSTSRCFETSGDLIITSEGSAVTALCAQVNCSTSSYTIRLSGSDQWIQCVPSTSVSLSSQSPIYSGSVTCPPYNEVCFQWTQSSTSSDNGSDSTESYVRVPVFLLLFLILFSFSF